MINIGDIVRELERFAPPVYQESYDNARLITGSLSWQCSGAVLCLDALESVVDEAIALQCNLIIAHHPIIFSGLKSLTGKNYIEKVIIKAIKNDIAIYAAHTNLDNVQLGVNHKISERLGLQNLKILDPKKGILKKLYTYVPESHLHQVMEALFAAGAGQIGNYTECSFSYPGIGTFRGNEEANPFLGQKGLRQQEAEHKLEVLLDIAVEPMVLNALFSSHPYEEVAYELITIDNVHKEVGSGMIGELPEAMDSLNFLKLLKEKMGCATVRHTHLIHSKVQKIAVCGGAGIFLLPKAIAAGADVFVTADVKYHQFFDAEGRILIADIGHYESEQFTTALFYDILISKFPNFALHLSKVNTNPVNYL
jgi:dinuclear metal center YbgI/SA1388 family protein